MENKKNKKNTKRVMLRKKERGYDTAFERKDAPL